MQSWVMRYGNAIFWIIALGAVLIRFYYPTLQPIFFPLDDSILILNPQILGPMSWQAFVALFTPGHGPDFYPIRDLFYIFDHQLFHNTPYFIALHQLSLFFESGIVIFVCLRLLGITEKIALLWLTLWALHPMHTEMIVWLSARKDVLALCFGSYAFLGFLLALKKNSTLLYWISGALFVFSLLSKASLTPLPWIGIAGVLLGFEALQNKKTKTFLITLSMIALIYSFFTGWFYSTVNDLSYGYAWDDRVWRSLAALGKMVAGWFNPSLNIIDTENWGPWLQWNQKFIGVGILVWVLILGGIFYGYCTKNKILCIFGLSILFLYLPVSGLIFPHRNLYSVRYLEPAFLIFTLGVTFLLSQTRLPQVAQYAIFGWGIVFALNLSDETRIWSKPLTVIEKGLQQQPQSLSLKILKWYELTSLYKRNPQDDHLKNTKNLLQQELEQTCAANAPEHRKSCSSFWGNYVSSVGGESKLPMSQILDFIIQDDSGLSPVVKNSKEATVLFFQLAFGQLELGRLKAWNEKMRWKALANHRILEWIAECLTVSSDAGKSFLNDRYKKNLLLPNMVEIFVGYYVSEQYKDALQKCK